MAYSVNGIDILPSCNFTYDGQSLSQYKHEGILVWSKELMLTTSLGTSVNTGDPYETCTNASGAIDIPAGSFTKLKVTGTHGYTVHSGGTYGAHSNSYISLKINGQWVNEYAHLAGCSGYTNHLSASFSKEITIDSRVTGVRLYIKVLRENIDYASQGNAYVKNVSILATG